MLVVTAAGDCLCTKMFKIKVNIQGKSFCLALAAAPQLSHF